MTPDLQRAYEESCRPFVEGGGAIGNEQTTKHSWRYFLEVNSMCNLHCPTCTKGNQGTGYEHLNGIMDPDLMEKCIDKIASENPQAIVFLYGNSEPFVHPRLPECIAAVNKRGLRCEFSTNLNYTQRVDDTLAAGPAFIIVSLSGFTQDVYVRGHQGGNIERVKSNMKVLGTVNQKYNVPINVNYHLYNDNAHELEQMRAYAKECGMGLFVSTARAISMENSIQYCRERDPESTPIEGFEWLPPTSQQWRDTMDRLKIPPIKAKEMYAHYPESKLCPVGAGGMFTYIRHDGKTQMCSCTADRRITVGDYLTTTSDQMIEQRVGHAVCKQCTKYHLNHYFMITDRDKWD